MDSPAERLEIAFADLYPDKVPANWQKPKIDLKSPPQAGAKKVPAKAAVARTASDASEGQVPVAVPASDATRLAPL